MATAVVYNRNLTTRFGSDGCGRFATRMASLFPLLLLQKEPKSGEHYFEFKQPPRFFPSRPCLVPTTRPSGTFGARCRKEKSVHIWPGSTWHILPWGMCQAMCSLPLAFPINCAPPFPHLIPNPSPTFNPTHPTAKQQPSPSPTLRPRRPCLSTTPHLKACTAHL